MRLSQFQALVELRKSGTISKAAKHLYVSQPSLSAAMKELEEELGFQIINRTKKGVIFTALGELVLQRSQKIMEEVDAIKRLSNHKESVLHGCLSVGSVPYICHTVILNMILHLKEKYPKMEVRLQEDSSYHLAELVARKEIGIGVVMISNLEDSYFARIFEEYHLEFYHLFTDQMYFWIGPKHPFYDREQATMEEILSRHGTTLVTYKGSLNNFNRNMLLAYNKEMDIVQIDEAQSLRRYVINTEATVPMPMCTKWLNDDYEKKLLKPLHIKDMVWTVRIGCILPKDEYLFLEEREFLSMLMETCQNHSSTAPGSCIHLP